MTPKKLLEIRQSEIRQRLAQLAETDATPETETEISGLSKEYQAAEVRMQAMIIADDAPAKVETRDSKAELFTRASVGDLVYALVNGRSGADGAMQELQSEYGLGSNEIHVRQLSQQVETRAVSPAPGNVGQDQQPIIPYVFPMACAAWLGIDMPTVSVGEAVFPVLTSTLAVHTPAENAAAAETTGSFSGDVLAPSRLQAAFFYSREDRARFRDMDSSLRENLSMGLADGLDKAIISGTNGLLTGANLANNAAAAVTDFDGYISELAFARVDGRYASMTGDLRVVMGSGTYAHAGGVYRATESDRTALDRLMDITGGVKVSAHVPDVTNANKQNAVIRRGMARDMVAPLWENVTLIPDEITLAAEGQIKLTAVLLHAVKILRVAGFHKQETQHA